MVDEPPMLCRLGDWSHPTDPACLPQVDRNTVRDPLVFRDWWICGNVCKGLLPSIETRKQ